MGEEPGSTEVKWKKKLNCLLYSDIPRDWPGGEARSGHFGHWKEQTPEVTRLARSPGFKEE